LLFELKFASLPSYINGVKPADIATKDISSKPAHSCDLIASLTLLLFVIAIPPIAPPTINIRNMQAIL